MADSDFSRSTIIKYNRFNWQSRQYIHQAFEPAAIRLRRDMRKWHYQNKEMALDELNVGLTIVPGLGEWEVLAYGASGVNLVGGIDENSAIMLDNYKVWQNQDCSEIAADFYSQNPGGKIYQLNPQTGYSMEGFENGATEGFSYHQFYMKDNYVYDPMFSSDPVPMGDYMEQYNSINPGGLNLQEIKP